MEHTRGLRFRHPVAVEYLSDADFRRELVDDPRALSARERRDQRDEEETDRALGLPGGPGGLLEAGNTLSGEGTLAFYDDQTERIEVRGTEMTVERRTTLVHELTHALQDQHFDISREGSYRSDDRNAAFGAVIEGDAVRIEDAYVASLPGAEQADYDRQQASGYADYEARTAGVPDWLSATSDAPYTVGESFTAALAANGGRRAVDRALRTPPRSQAHTMQTDRYLRGDRPRKVRSPAVPAGDPVAKRNDLGALRWLLFLAERMPATEALKAVDGWDGDAYVAYRHRGRLCVKADFAGEGRAATDEMAGT
ncbi:MAG TPA: hypothetical protein VGR20_01040, partial [Acidimicrobiia bacterium]|nr:hypothetical protein [Acidimicrobiia bacterium]